MRNSLLALTLVALTATGTAAAMDAEEVIKYRNSVMKAYAGHTGAASRIVRGKVDYKDQLGFHATAMRDISLLIEGLFPEDSDFGETRAKAEIWSKPEEYKQAMKDNQQAAEAFLKAVNDGTADAAGFKAVTDSCKGCHDKFRAEDD